MAKPKLFAFKAIVPCITMDGEITYILNIRQEKKHIEEAVINTPLPDTLLTNIRVTLDKKLINDGTLIDFFNAVLQKKEFLITGEKNKSENALHDLLLKEIQRINAYVYGLQDTSILNSLDLDAAVQQYLDREEYAIVEKTPGILKKRPPSPSASDSGSNNGLSDSDDGDFDRASTVSLETGAAEADSAGHVPAAPSGAPSVVEAEEKIKKIFAARPQLLQASAALRETDTIYGRKQEVLETQTAPQKADVDERKRQLWKAQTAALNVEGLALNKRSTDLHAGNANELSRFNLPDDATTTSEKKKGIKSNPVENITQFFTKTSAPMRKIRSKIYTKHETEITAFKENATQDTLQTTLSSALAHCADQMNDLASLKFSKSSSLERWQDLFYKEYHDASQTIEKLQKTLGETQSDTSSPRTETLQVGTDTSRSLQLIAVKVGVIVKTIEDIDRDLLNSKPIKNPPSKLKIFGSLAKRAADYLWKNKILITSGILAIAGIACLATGFAAPVGIAALKVAGYALASSGVGIPMMAVASGFRLTLCDSTPRIQQSTNVLTKVLPQKQGIFKARAQSFERTLNLSDVKASTAAGSPKK